MKYFLIAGEASGDLHASNLMRELKNADSQAEFCFLGGDLMQAQGGKLIKHYRQMAYMGFLEILKNIRSVLSNMSDCRRAMVDFKPDVIILIDYPGFNLRMARFAKENLSIPIYYYISPKIWAWNESRVKQIKRNVTKVFTIFPFETAFYAKYNYSVEYVGNPSIDSVCLRPNQDQTFQEFCSINQLSKKPIIALLAGSRKKEILDCLSRMIDAATSFEDYQVVVAGAPGISADFYTDFIKGKPVQIVFGQTYELLQQAQAAVINSGTATLEAALIGTPQVVVYKIPFGKIGFFVKELVVQVEFVSLVNIVAEKLVVKELLAHLFTVKNVVAKLEEILNNKAYRQNMQNEYAVMKTRLGEPGAAERTAKKMVELLKIENNMPNNMD
jgi:lipid-A-disaccharide synthase